MSKDKGIYIGCSPEDEVVPPKSMEIILDNTKDRRGPNGELVVIPMLLWCPECGHRHIDVGEFATKAHHTHACQNCGMTWRPAIQYTHGIRFLPGFKNEECAV